MATQYTCEGIEVVLPDTWALNEEAAGTGLSFGRTGGVGALQISRVDAGGEAVEVSDLLVMLQTMAQEQALGDPADGALEPGPPMMVAASFRKAGWLIRVWYLSDGERVALATLTGDAGAEELEQDLVEAGLIIQGLTLGNT